MLETTSLSNYLAMLVVTLTSALQDNYGIKVWYISLRYVICTTLTQQLHNNTNVSNIFFFFGNVSFTTYAQLVHSSSSHEGGAHTLSPTLM
jgi:hypothetical protein